MKELQAVEVLSDRETAEPGVAGAVEGLPRRKVLVGLALTGVGLAGLTLPLTVNAQDCPDHRLMAQFGKLTRVLRNVRDADHQIKQVATRWVAPPDPTRPEFDVLLNDINAGCQHVIDTANELLLRRGA